MLKKVLNFINSTFKSSPLKTSIVEQKNIVDVSTTELVNNDVVEKKKRTRKKKEENMGVKGID